MLVIYGIETLLLCVIIFISVVFSLKISFSNYETNLYEIHDHQICNLLKYCVHSQLASESTGALRIASHAIEAI